MYTFCCYFIFIQELPHLKVVDLSHNKISNVFDLHMKIGNVAKLGLAHNQLASLEGTCTLYIHVHVLYCSMGLLAYTMYNIHVHVHVYRYMHVHCTCILCIHVHVYTDKCNLLLYMFLNEKPQFQVFSIMCVFKLHGGWVLNAGAFKFSSPVEFKHPWSCNGEGQEPRLPTCSCVYSTSHKKVKVPHQSSTEAVPN